MRPEKTGTLLIKKTGRFLTALFVFALALGMPEMFNGNYLPDAFYVYADETAEDGAAGGADTEETDVAPSVIDTTGRYDEIKTYDGETEDEAYERGAYFAGDPERLVFAESVEFGDSKPVKMLWLGDSIINRYEMAWQFAELCDANGIKLDVKVYAEDEASLENHMDGEEEPGELKNGNYDIVLLQEESHEIRNNPERTVELIEEMKELAPETTRFYLYETMAYRGQSYNQEVFHDAYTEVGEETKVPVIHAGDFYMELIDENPGREMYDNLQHPSGFGYGRLVMFLYEQLSDEIRKIYTARNPGSMTFTGQGMDGYENMGGALYIVKDSAGMEAGAFITDEAGLGYVAESEKEGKNETMYFGGGESRQRTYNGNVYTRSEKRELSLPSHQAYTVSQALAPLSGAYRIDDTLKLNDTEYSIREREITPVSYSFTVNRDYLSFSQYRVAMSMGQFQKLNIITEQEDTLTFESSNPQVAGISDDGVICAVRPGVTLITATCSNGISRKCWVEVRLI